MIQVIDNFISAEHQNELLSYLQNPYTPWYMGNPVMMYNVYSTCSADETADMMQRTSNIKESELFVLTAIDTDNVFNEVVQHTESIFNSIMNNIQSNINIGRAKFNMLTMKGIDYLDKHHTPHIDTLEDTHTAIYYVNDSDGDTFFFDNKDDLNTILRVSPRKGTMVIFPSDVYHASSSPVKNNIRITLNINFSVAL